MSPEDEVNLTRPFGQDCRAGQGWMSHPCGSSSLATRRVQLWCLLLGNLDFRCQGAAGTERFAVGLCREKPATGSFCAGPTSAKAEPSGWASSLKGKQKRGGNLCRERPEINSSGLGVCGRKAPLCWSLGLRDRTATA